MGNHEEVMNAQQAMKEVMLKPMKDNMKRLAYEEIALWTLVIAGVMSWVIIILALIWH
jgi:hypothetical protein